MSRGRGLDCEVKLEPSIVWCIPSTYFLLWYKKEDIYFIVSVYDTLNELNVFKNKNLNIYRNT